MSRIRIRFEHTAYGHWGGHSGYPRLAAYLDKDRFAWSRRGTSDRLADTPRWLRVAGPPLMRLLGTGGQPWYRPGDLRAELSAFAASMAGQVDIVHFLDGEHSGNVLPRLLRRAGSKVRTVASFHQPPHLLDGLVDPARLDLFDAIVLMSPSQLGWFEGKVAPGKARVILHGVDDGFFSPTRSGEVEVGPARSGPLRCITVGTWMRDWDLFNHVARAAGGIEFHAVTRPGQADESLPNVTRHEGLSDEALADLYRSADVLFMPLVDATANNALLEGLATGLPVVVTDLVSTRAYLGEAEALFLPPGQPDAALAALHALATDGPRRSQMALAARRRAEDLSWSRMVRPYEELYAALAGREPVGTGRLV